MKRSIPVVILPLAAFAAGWIAGPMANFTTISIVIPTDTPVRSS